MKKKPRPMTDEEIEEFTSMPESADPRGTEFYPSRGGAHRTCEICGQLYEPVHSGCRDNLNSQFCPDCDEDSPIEFI